MIDCRNLQTGLFAFLFLLPCAIQAQPSGDNEPPIHYLTAPVHDRVAKLSEAMAAGSVKLDYDDEHGYLKSVLQLLDVPVSSQTLVFSKTSLQLHHISSHRPRALYFNDDVYVGFVQQGEVLELAVTDPQLGAVFYTLEQTPDLPPKFVRDQGECLGCHTTNRTQNVPGYLVRSVYPNATGRPEYGRGTFTTDHSSRFKERWGGWYVTGSHGEMRHMGNVMLADRDGELDLQVGANQSKLDQLVDTTPYPSKHSDLVALMVLGHQTQMHNAIAWANYETRRAIYQTQIMNRALDREPDFLSDSTRRRIDRAADHLLQYLLMCDEFTLTSPVSGTSSFADDFQAHGKRDQQHRSLRDLDLTNRLLRYPCSYLIHSEAFAGLPDEVRSVVLTKLATILAGDDDSETYGHLTPVDRTAIREILTDTLPEFAAIKPPQPE